MTVPDYEPAEALADLSEEGQVALLTQTDNRLGREDRSLPQPPQDAGYRPEGGDTADNPAQEVEG